MAKKSKKEASRPVEVIEAPATSTNKKKKKAAAPVQEAEPEAPALPEAEAETSHAKKSSKNSKKGKSKKDAQAPVEDTVEPVAEVVVPPAAEEAPAPGKKGRKGKGKKSEDVSAEDSPAVETPVEATEIAASDTSDAALEQVAAEASAEPAPEPGEAAPAEPEKPAVNLEEIARNVEALLFAAEEPLQARELARCSGSDSPTIRKLIPQIKERYAAERRPWDVAEVANGWRLVTRPEFYPVIQKLKTQTLQRKLTQAALETLALIAYRQPLSRAEIENVRGVGAGPVLRQLLERKLIKISGRGTGLGQPLLYGTTDYFLEHFGLNSIQDLPKPREFKQ